MTASPEHSDGETAGMQAEPGQQSLANAMAKILGRDVDDEKAPVLSLNAGVVNKVDHTLAAEAAARKVSKQKKRIKLKCHAKRPMLSTSRERRLKTLATRGVVHLFNAILKAQKHREAEALPGPTDKRNASSREKSQETKKEAEGAGWDVLQDDFMMEPGLGDWDAGDQEGGDDGQEDDEEYGDAGIASDSEDD